jgi:hypothetical protein
MSLMQQWSAIPCWRLAFLLSPGKLEQAACDDAGQEWT